MSKREKERGGREKQCYLYKSVLEFLMNVANLEQEKARKDVKEFIRFEVKNTF